MKTLYIAFTILAVTAFASCKKCETCVPHHYSNGVIGAVDDDVVHAGTQAIKLCDQRDIKAYESLTTLTAQAPADTVRFICQ